MRETSAVGALADPRDTAPDMTPISDLLGHVSTELRDLCAIAFRVEKSVAVLVDSAAPNALAELRGLQELDRLIQHIDGLAAYLGELAVVSEGLGAVDAGAARRVIKQQNLAAALAGQRETAAGGDVEFL
ncbi:MAG: hypothetical protein ACK4WC_07305 [Rubrimonas sp.]